MKECRFVSIICTLVAAFTLLSMPAPAQASDISYGEFPQSNAWYQATPSVVWYSDPESTTTLEVHIIGRKDVNRVWLTNLGSYEPDHRKELYDDGTHGDKAAGDHVFTLADVILPGVAERFVDGYQNWWGYLRVELKDGSQLGNQYSMIAGIVDPKYKNAFPVKDYGNSLSATPYAFFIQDSGHKVIDNYPVAKVYCGTENYNAYKKFYSVFPDRFDLATLMPGMQIFHPGDLGENVPYNVSVSNNVKHIGKPMMDKTSKFGSAGRLKSAIYSSFGSISIITHEIGHTWMAYLGSKLGLVDEQLGHWSELADMHGQMGLYYFEGDTVGNFAYNGDETWHLITNDEKEPYSPIELYAMGLIPSSEIPDVHILKKPDLSDPKRITAKSYKTVTAKQIVKSAGGERIPSFADSQKEFNMAFIVTQDLPYNDAAYAYFSLLSQKLMSCEPLAKNSYTPLFYWSTGGRATLNTSLQEYDTLPSVE